MIKLLFIEDDEACAYVTQGGLELLDVYDICWAKNGKEALEKFESFAPDVIVSDIEMPEMDGYEFTRKVRERNKEVLILLASGKAAPKDVLKGYELGIDEYVKKPYIADELHARIEAILRRTNRLPSRDTISNEINSNLIYIGRYQFDDEEKTLELIPQIKLKLTKREAGILKLLHDNKNKLVPRKEILLSFWEGDDSEFSSRSLDVFISKLRKYLSEDSSIKIVNVRGEGLRLEIS